MHTTEFQQHFGNITSEGFSRVTVNWLQLPAYPELPADLLAKAKILTEPQGAVGAFIEQHRQAVGALVKENKHFEAMGLVDQRLGEIEKIFLGDDLITARIFTYRRRGWIKEQLATFGEMSHYPLGDSMRTLCFIGGAMDYMQGDLELGCVTDYAGRAAECFGGAGMHELQAAALVKLFGRNVIIAGVDSMEAMTAQDIVRRAIETKNIDSIPGGGEAKIVTAIMPNPQLN